MALVKVLRAKVSVHFMNRKLYPLLLLIVVATFPAYGNTYLGVEQAQKLMFGDAKFTPVAIQLADAIRATWKIVH